MSRRDNVGSRGTDGTNTKNKGESQQSHQKGAKSVAAHNTGKHRADESEGASNNTTKKQSNAV
jgi:hypothetical protein